jgi:hypothetical protein
VTIKNCLFYLNELREIDGEAPVTFGDAIRRLYGRTSDHANDQKCLAEMMKRLKDTEWFRKLGQEAMANKTTEELREIAIKINNDKWESAGGRDAFEDLPDEEREERESAAAEAYILESGKLIHSNLKPDDKRFLEITVWLWTGCCMHKDLNVQKIAVSDMQDYWKGTGVEPMPHFNAQAVVAISEMKEGAEPTTFAEKEALRSVERGAIKMAQSGGLIFDPSGKNFKHGQGLHAPLWFEQKIGKALMFPKVNQTRYGSNGEACAVFVQYLDEFREYFTWISDRKDTPGLNNLERNVCNGLSDVPTISEMAALAIYHVAVSKPYMIKVRSEPNMLTLGDYHQDVISHCREIADCPMLLFQGYGCLARLGGGAWEKEDQGLVDAILRLRPHLPHLEGLVVALFDGATRGWEHFTSEFAAGGAIASLSKSERDQYQMRPTNDISEGGLGAKRIYLRKAPSHSQNFFNGLMMLRYNKTSSWIRQHIGHDKRKGRWLRQQGRLLTMGKIERARRRRLVEADALRVQENRVKMKKKAAAKRKREEEIQATIDRTTLSLDKEWLQARKTTDKQLKDQLTVWLTRYPDLPKVKSGPKAAKVAACLQAVDRFHADQELASPVQTTAEGEGDVEMEDGETLADVGTSGN